MKLTDLDPHWLGAGGDGVFKADGSPAPPRHGVGVSFDCPCGQEHPPGTSNRVAILFLNPLDGGPPYADPGQNTWARTGDTFETLSLRPSIARREECRWHGFVTDGNVVTV